MGLRFDASTNAIYMDEQAAPGPASVAGQGTLWIRDDTPNTLVFTDDAGTDVVIAEGGAVAGTTASTSLVGVWNYDSTVTVGTDPGANNIAFSNATPTSANRFSIRYIDLNGVDWKQHILDAWTGSGEFGILVRMTKVGDPTTYMVWSINSGADATTWNAPYVNMVEWEGTWTNGDDMYVEIQTQPYMQRPTTDRGMYYGRASLSGQPLCGGLQSANFKVNVADDGWNVTNSGSTVTWSQAGAAATISGASIWRRNASNRHEWYGSANILPVVSIFEGLVEYGHDNHTGDGAPRLKIHERSTNGGSEAEWGILWVKNDAPNNLYFTDDAGTDYNLTNPGQTATTITTGWSTGSGGGSFTIGANAPLLLEEQANDDSPAANYGQVWVQTDTPNRLMFTDDSGQDVRVTPYRATLQTTDATQTEIISISVASGTTFGYRINIVGNESATGDTVFESIFGAIHNQAGTTAIVGSDIVDRTEDAGAAAWVVTVAADDTTDALTVDVTGEASHTIDWKVSVEILDV